MKTVLPAAVALLLSAGTAAGQTPPPAPPPAGAPHPADADRDGVVTRAEALADADRRFAAMDADRDGRVTPEERRAHRRDGPGREGGGRVASDLTPAQLRDRAAKMFDRVDTNRDGRIDAQEREAARLLRRARMVDRRD